MGTLLKVSNADFSENGIEIIAGPQTEQNLIPTFQANMMPLGTYAVITNSNLQQGSGYTRISSNKVTIPTGAYILAFKPKTGFYINVAAWNGASAKGTAATGALATVGGWSWVTANRPVAVYLNYYEDWVVSIRYTDDVTTFASNSLVDYMEYIKLISMPTDPIERVKAVLEAYYFIGVVYSGAVVTGVPTGANAKRCAVGLITGDMFDNVSFVVTPKAGCRIVPIQSTDQAGSGKYQFTWVTTAVTFSDFTTKPNFGLNLSFTDDSVIPENTSIWDFIDVTLPTA